MPSNLPGTVALVTGASSGIGSALARRLALQGCIVWAVGRRPHRLEALHRDLAAAGATLRPYPCDLRESDQLTHLVTEIHAESGRLDIVVNNAGIMATGNLDKFSEESLHEMQTVNGTAPMVLTKAVLNLLSTTANFSARRFCDLLFVGSTAAKVGFAGGAVYNFAKFGITGFSEAVRHELRGHGIRVSTIHPGTTATELFTTDRTDDDSLGPVVADDTDHALAPTTVADMVLHVLEQPRHVCIPELTVCPSGDAF